MNMPEEGGVLDQSPLLMTHIEVAWRTWQINAAKRPQEHTQSDTDFMRRWVFNEDSQNG